MRIGRTLPPAASPLYWSEIFAGIGDMLNKRSRRIEELKIEILKFFGVSHCFLVSSGKTALSITLKALHAISPDRNEVVIPAFACYSIPSSILRAGLKIRLCDINTETIDYDYDQLQKLLEDNKGRVLAVIPVHMFGIPSDVYRLKMLNHEARFWIVEDAAQAMGNSLNQKLLGTIGDVGIFSMGRGKSLSVVEGGVIITNRNEIAEKINEEFAAIPQYRLSEVLVLLGYAISLKILLHPSLFWIPKMIPQLRMGETIYDPNFTMRKMSIFQAGLSKTWIHKLNRLKSVRKKNAVQWLDMLKERNPGSLRIPSAVSKVCDKHSSSDTAMIRMPFMINDNYSKKKLLDISEENGFGLMPTYPDSINNIEELRDQFKGENYPKSKNMAQKSVTFPTNAFVRHRDKVRTVNCLGYIISDSVQNDKECKNA